MPPLEAGLSPLLGSMLGLVLVLTRSSLLAACPQGAAGEPPPSWLKRERVGEGGGRLGQEGRGQTLRMGGHTEHPRHSQGEASQHPKPTSLHTPFPSCGSHPLGCPRDPQPLSQAK